MVYLFMQPRRFRLDEWDRRMMRRDRRITGSEDKQRVSYVKRPVLIVLLAYPHAPVVTRWPGDVFYLMCDGCHCTHCRQYRQRRWTIQGYNITSSNVCMCTVSVCDVT